jgi:hypothetical protein
MSKQQPLADTTSAESKYLKELVDNPPRLSIERRTLLLARISHATEAMV